MVHQDGAPEGVDKGQPQRGVSEESEQIQGHDTRMPLFCDPGSPVPLANPPTVGAVRESLRSGL